MKKKILRTIKEQELLEKDTHIVLGLSGGPDSVCLFDVLFELADEMNWTIWPVHINHKFRPGAAEEDQLYVENLCRDRGLECYTVVRDCNELARTLGKTSEEAGRIARYQAFGQKAAELVEKGVPKKDIVIAVAHNADDQCETLLFRIMRGTGIDGLAGIPYKRQNEEGFFIVRPLMDVKREDIEAYCREKGLHPRVDSTNAENLYTRNKIRNLLIPHIEANFNENIVDTINRLGKLAARDKEYLWQQAQEAYLVALESEDEKEVILFINNLSSLHKSIRLRVYAKALQHVGMSENRSFAQLEAVDELIDSDSPSASCDLSDGFKAFRIYERIAFCSPVSHDGAGQWRLRSMTCAEYEEYKTEGVFHGAFSGVDSAKLEIRTRKAGDRINIGRGFKKLQDFMTDEKVPKHYRDKVQLLALGSDVLWILPSKVFQRESLRTKGRFSADYKVNLNEDQTIIVLECITKM